MFCIIFLDILTSFCMPPDEVADASVSTTMVG